MNVIFLSPAFPAEMPLFTHALAECGARVLGVGEGHVGAIPRETRDAMTAYLQVKSLWDEEAVCNEVERWLGGRSVDRVECLWEPGVVLAARLRERLGVRGMSVEHAAYFRDKELMKQALDRAGVRTPRHARARTAEEVRAAAEEIGFPLILKPIAGAGSADTYHVRDGDELDQAVELSRHVSEVSVEEYIEGEEFTFDTVCANGEILFHNVAWYRPKPLTARQNEWISSQVIALRDTDAPEIQKGRHLGAQVMEALHFEDGFTHMEWFLTPGGEAIFGEIGARAPGARVVHSMNYSCDADLFAGWAEATLHGRISQKTDKVYNAAVVFKRARGQGIVQRYEGLAPLLARYGDRIPVVDLTPIGAPRRDWRSSVVGDGWLVARHPNLQETLEMADKLSSEFSIIAG